MRWTLLAVLFSGCLGHPSPTETAVSELCPDGRISGAWTEVDVSARAPIGGVAVIGHSLTFAPREGLPEGTFAERWDLADGTAIDGIATYAACGGAITIRPPEPTAGALPVLRYSVDAGRLQLDAAVYQR